MKTYFCDHFVLPLPEGHRFPMEKYALLRQELAGESELTLRVPEAADDAALLLVHTPTYVESVVRGTLREADVRRIGFPWSHRLVERSRRSVGGTLSAARSALREGWSANLAGGTHHAFADRGEGFCVFNDVAVATRWTLARDLTRRVSVIDLDVHQGNGTAAIFRDDPQVFTISVHGTRNYPFAKEPGDLDIALPDGADDRTFLNAVARAAEASVAHRPDLTFYVAGADAYERDRLGRLAVTRRGLARRDELVVEAHARAGVPLVVVMGGGYCEEIRETVGIHATSVRTAARFWRAKGDGGSVLGRGASPRPTPAPVAP